MSAICDECGKDIGWGSNIPGTVTLCPLCNCNHVVYSKTPEQRIADLEAQLAEANEAARLQMALDRIEAAGGMWSMSSVVIVVRLHRGPIKQWQVLQTDLSIVKAAEAAAAWCEGQKEV